MRPPSIVTFERLYLGALAIGLVATAISWRANDALLAGNPASAHLAAWFLPLSTLASTVLMLALWHGIARRRSVIVKWILVGWTALVVLAALPGALALVQGQVPMAGPALLALASTILQAVAAAMLFNADARHWFDRAAAMPREPLP